MTQFDDINRFIEASRLVSSPRDLERLISDITKEMGFDYYALVHHVNLSQLAGDLSHMDAGELVAITNYPEAWVETYIKRNIVANDPVLLASHRTNVGFRWERVPDMIEVTSAHREITADTRRAGIMQGYTVPAYVPGEANGSCSFAMGSGRPMPENVLPMAQLVGSFAFQAARTLVQAARKKSTLAEPVRLTNRQLDCIRHVARGKGDNEISRILGISEQTVKQHLRLAREQFGVPKRVQLVVRAIFGGQLPLEDAIK